MPLEIDSPSLYGMLTDLSLTRLSGDDHSAPGWCAGILLHTGDREGRHVPLGTASDRYTLGQAHEAVSGELEITLVSPAGVGRLLHALAPHRAQSRATRVHLSRDEDTGGLWLRVGRDHIGAETLEAETFPRLALFTELTPAEAPFVVNHALLAPFVTIAKRRREWLHLSPGHHKTGLVIGNRYRGLLMHARNVDQPATPWFDPAHAVTADPDTPDPDGADEPAGAEPAAA